jgi:hypothetical protein
LSEAVGAGVIRYVGIPEVDEKDDDVMADVVDDGPVEDGNRPGGADVGLLEDGPVENDDVFMWVYVSVVEGSPVEDDEELLVVLWLDVSVSRALLSEDLLVRPLGTTSEASGGKPGAAWSTTANSTRNNTRRIMIGTEDFLTLLRGSQLERMRRKKLSLHGSTILIYSTLGDNHL